MDCSVILLNYNTKDYLERCMRSVYRHTSAISFDVWAVDNASQDGSAAMVKEKFPQAHLIANQENLFVAKGFNVGIRASSGRYVFIGDADLEFTDNFLAKMVEYMDKNPRVAVLGCPFYYPNGDFFSKCYSRDHSFLFSLLNFTFLGKFFRETLRKLTYNFEYGEWDRKSSRAVEIVDTAVLFRREALDQAGLYDEKFYLYAIQNDICLRLRQYGWEIYYLYEGHLAHAQHQSINKANWKHISTLYRKDMAHYFYKRFGWLASMTIMLLLHITRYLVYIAAALGLFKPKKNIAFGTP